MTRTAARNTASSAERRTEGFSALYAKELADHFRSVRYRIVFALFLLTNVLALSGALGNVADQSSSEYIFLSLFTVSGDSLPSVASFMAYLAPIVGLALGFDAINRERAQGTLNRLVSQPVYRDCVINAKFLAGVTVIAILVFFVGGFVAGVGLISIGIPPSGEEIMRIVSFLLLTVVYTSLWLGCAILCSTCTRHAATSALVMIALWIFFTMFASMLASALAGVIYPTDGIQGYANLMKYYRLDLALSRCSPYYLFCEAVTTLLNPNIRTVGITTQASYSGAIASYLSFDQSVLLIWPHIVVMIALSLAAFAVSYICFMRQEIRA